MKKYTTLEHTADLKIGAKGKTREELFSNLAFGLFENINQDLQDLKEDVERDVFIEAVDEQSLLVDFLSELLTLSDTNDEVYKIFKLEITDNTVKGTVWGSKVEENDLDVKAVTYHELKFEKNKDGYLGEIVFDI